MSIMLTETEKSHDRRINENFYNLYLKGRGLDIGFRGNASQNIAPIMNSIGIDFGYKGYDGIYLPFDDMTMDFVYASHCMEHIIDKNLILCLQEWFRVLKINGFLIITVPHQYLYEKKLNLPSKYNPDHKRFYTPGKLLYIIENILIPNTYRIIYVKDCDYQFDYNIPPEQHSCGEYQVECVIQKIMKPKWDIL